MAASPTPTRYQRQPTMKTAMKTATRRTAPRRSSRRSASASVRIERPLGNHRRLPLDPLEVREPADREAAPRALAVVVVGDGRGEGSVAGVGVDRDLGGRGLEQAHRRERDLRGALDVALALPAELPDRHAAVI